MTHLTRLAVSCGGTGGHFNPGLGVAREFNRNGGSALLLLGGKNAPGQMKQAAAVNVLAAPVDCVRPSKNPLRLFAFVLSLWRGIRQTRKLLKEFQPQAVLIMGSFASIPPAVAARLEHIPVFLHDGNARIGKANRWFSRGAQALALSFSAVNADTVQCPTVLTGLPLRRELLEERLTRDEAIRRVNEKFQASLDPSKATLLIFGGSQGAAAINDHFSVDSADPAVKNLQIIHLAGAGKADVLREKYANFPCPVLLLESCSEMALMYGAADAVICRSGGSSVSELAFFGKYALLIPYPYAAEGHQDDNARWLAAGGGARIVSNADCTPELFRAFVSEFLAHRAEFLEAGKKSERLAMPDAAARVLEMIENITFRKDR